VTTQDPGNNWDRPANHVFYLATPPVSWNHCPWPGVAGWLPTGPHARIVVEKPFGHDLASALPKWRADRCFNEAQIYRTIITLAKKPFNILAFRFAMRC